jgi:hypothetical protein
MSQTAEPKSATLGSPPGSRHMLSFRRLLTAAALTCAAALVPLAAATTPALASKTQIGLFEADGSLAGNPQPGMDQLRALGAQEVRVYVEWSAVAPSPSSFSRPKGFSPTSTNGYNWSHFTDIVNAAKKDHLKLDFVLSGGAPDWAISKGYPKGGAYIHYAWKPNAALWGDFVHAAVAKFDGYVKAWEIYNEPNFGEDLAPQKSGKYDLGASQYRTLLESAWKAFTSLHQTHAQITIAQITARGQSGGSLPGNYGQTKPLSFIRDLYCVDTKFKQLTGSAAKYAGCPTTTSAKKKFASSNPGLFHSSGLGIHPYPVNLAPTKDASRDPNFVTFNKIPTLEKSLDSIAKTYHAHSGTPLYNNEYGYVTTPPYKHGDASPAQAAVYMNQAEYLSYKDSRIRTYMQYLLVDPPTGGASQFFSGLEFSNGSPKDTFYAYRMPLWIPTPTVKKGKTAEVWGGARPSVTLGNHGKVTIAWRKNATSPLQSLATVSPARGTGYFDVKVKFPASGQVVTAWADGSAGTIYSRAAPVTVR